MLTSEILNCHFCLILNVSHKDHTGGVFPHLAEIEHRFPILVNQEKEMPYKNYDLYCIECLIPGCNP